MFTEFGISFVLAFAIVQLVLSVVVIFYLYTMNHKMAGQITSLSDLILKVDNENRRRRRNGAIARVLRQLANAVDQQNYSVTHPSSEVTRVFLHGVSIDLAVDDTRDSSERGQLCAVIEGYPTIQSCLDDLKHFVRRIVELSNKKIRDAALNNWKSSRFPPTIQS